MLSTDAARTAPPADRPWFDRPLPAKLETILSLAARALGFPTVRINIVLDDLQRTIGFFGVGDLCPIDRSESFCDVVVSTGHYMAVPDATLDSRFSGLASVLSGEIGAYLGVPLRGAGGRTIGALCVIDPIGRTLTDEDTWRLQQFVPIVEDQLALLWQLETERQEGRAATGNGDGTRLDPVVPWFRPIVGLSSRRILGYDVLANRIAPDGRISDPRRRLVGSPQALLALDIAVAGQAMVAVRRWQEHDPRLKVTVNIASSIIAHPDCVETLSRLAADAGIKPVDVDITIKEPPAWSIADEEAMARLRGLRDSGFGVIRDEFGIAWAGLDQLLWFPFDAVRLDPAVTAALGTEIGDTLIRAVTEVAHSLGHRVVVDDIRSPGQARAATVLGCDRAVGQLWGPAESESAIDLRYRSAPAGSASQTVR